MLAPESYSVLPSDPTLRIVASAEGACQRFTPVPSTGDSSARGWHPHTTPSLHSPAAALGSMPVVVCTRVPQTPNICPCHLCTGTCAPPRPSTHAQQPSAVPADTPPGPMPGSTTLPHSSVCSTPWQSGCCCCCCLSSTLAGLAALLRPVTGTHVSIPRHRMRICRDE